MADSTIPNLVAVAVPAGTDLFGVRQSGDVRDKKLTATQLLSLVTIPDPLLLSAGTVGAPTYSFTGDPDTGVFEVSADILGLAAGGISGLQVVEVGGLITIPTFGPILAPDGTAAAPSYSFINETNAGFFKRINDELNVSVGGVEVASFLQTGFNAPDGTSAKAGLGFLSEDSTGFHLAAGSKINVALSGTTTWAFTATTFGATQSGARPALRDQVATATVPNIVPNKDDADTGIGTPAPDQLSLIVGGQEGLRLIELNNGVVQQPAADLAITAFAGGGQGSAVALKQSYNLITVSATAGDSVKLPDSFNTTAIILIRNNGANAVDVFPASGDDLGQGVNIAESLAAGGSITYIATVFSATWAPFFIGNLGVSDPLLLGDGTASNPTYSFADDPNTGIFSNLDDSVALVAGGLICMSVSESGGARQIGFYEGSPIPLQTGVAVTTAAIHAALVALRLITA